MGHHHAHRFPNLFSSQCWGPIDILGRVLLEHGAVLWVPPFSNSCLSLNGVSLQPTRTEVRAWYTCDTSANYYIWWPFHGP